MPHRPNLGRRPARPAEPPPRPDLLCCGPNIPRGGRTSRRPPVRAPIGANLLVPGQPGRTCPPATLGRPSLLQAEPAPRPGRASSSSSRLTSSSPPCGTSRVGPLPRSFPARPSPLGRSCCARTFSSSGRVDQAESTGTRCSLPGSHVDRTNRSSTSVSSLPRCTFN